MEAWFIATASAESSVILGLIGYVFKMLPEMRSRVASLTADLKGMTLSYEREKERVADMAAVERDAKQAAMIGQAVASALAKLPPEGS